GDKVIAQYPAKGETVAEGAKVILKTEGVPLLPDFTGWSKRDLLAFQSLSGLSLEIAGQGFAVSQSLSQGAEVAPREPIVIQLLTPEESFNQLMADGPEGIPETDAENSSEEGLGQDGLEAEMDETAVDEESVEEPVIEEGSILEENLEEPIT